LAHRGKHPQDDILFSDKEQIKLREAVKDLSFLLGRGYGYRSAGLLVGNRYELTARQIQALYRISCSKVEAKTRSDKEIAVPNLNNSNVEIDGYKIPEANILKLI
jgi:hypothetical protein